MQKRNATYRARSSRLLAAILLSCSLVTPPVSVADASAAGTGATGGVDVQVLGASLTKPDAWALPPLVAHLEAHGPGVVWYRFGPGPGPWERSYGYVAIPDGEQTMSFVLVAPDGTAGPVGRVTTRSDMNADGLGGLLPAAQAPVSYVGGSQVEGDITVSVVVGKQLGIIVRRLGGLTRYDTSVAISSSTGTRPRTVILATGDLFADALTASGLAGAMHSPILLVRRNSIPAATKLEIQRLGVKRAILCGGTTAVSSRPVKLLQKMGLKVERVGGRTRFDTAVAVSKRIQKITKSRSRVFIARDDKFSTALMISPMAYASRSPILLTKTTKLSSVTDSGLRAGKYRRAVVIGTMSSATLRAIKKRVKYLEVWGGNGTYDTAVQVATKEVQSGELSWKYVGIARGDLFPDALCGGAYAGMQGGVILLTPPTSLDPGSASTLASHTADIKRCDIYGSSYAIADTVMTQIQAIFP